jgi:hypothetical protein
MNLYGKLSKNHKLAINYFADMLFTKQMKKNITLRVTFTEHIKNFGETEITDYNCIGKPRSFNIIIKKDIGDDEILRTLSHEMVHIKQYVYGHLNEQMTYWRGKKVTEEQFSYFDSPWEKEAHEIGDKLYGEFIDEKCDT